MRHINSRPKLEISNLTFNVYRFCWISPKLSFDKIKSWMFFYI